MCRWETVVSTPVTSIFVRPLVFGFILTQFFLSLSRVTAPSRITAKIVGPLEDKPEIGNSKLF